MALGNQGQIGPYRVPTSGMLRLSTLQQGGPYSVDYLIAAGGGGGSTTSNDRGGGGGGAGGLALASVTLVSKIAYTVTIGAGGAANTIGGNSSIGTIYAIGGGAGSGGSGGSGGGANQTSSNIPGGLVIIAGQGNIGGSSTGDVTIGYSGGGGGGAGGAGTNGGTSSSARAGGVGTSSSLSGSAVTYSVGGNGAGTSSTTGAAGGANTGNGGGGSNFSNTGGAGGSGIVIIRYLGAPRATGGTITSSGGYTIHTFTASGTFTA